MDSASSPPTASVPPPEWSEATSGSSPLSTAPAPSHDPFGRERTGPGEDQGPSLGGDRPSFGKRLLAPLIALGALLAKFKGVLLFLPKLKLLTTAGTMLVSIAAYSFIWGWQFAVGFVLLILVHEMGHVIQLRREGIPASAPLFIPFLGAVIGTKSLGENAVAEARVGLAGPILGSLGAALLLPIYAATGDEFWRALAFTGFFLNLFNLLPVTPLDGGRAFAAMAPWMWFVGLAGLLAFVLAFPTPIGLLIVAFGAYSTFGRWRRMRKGGPEQQAYYRVSKRDRLMVFAIYLGLAGALAYGMDATHLVRTIPS